jgi:hypothetical protein
MFKTSPNRTYHKSTKRKQIDPTTCERDYTADELEFMQALERYKKSSGRKFPTCSEILEVVRSLGYQRPVHAQSSSDSESMESDSLGAASAICDVVASAESTLDQIDRSLKSLD